MTLVGSLRSIRRRWAVGAATALIVMIAGGGALVWIGEAPRDATAMARFLVAGTVESRDQYVMDTSGAATRTGFAVVESAASPEVLSAVEAALPSVFTAEELAAALHASYNAASQVVTTVAVASTPEEALTLSRAFSEALMANADALNSTAATPGTLRTVTLSAPAVVAGPAGPAPVAAVTTLILLSLVVGAGAAIASDILGRRVRTVLDLPTADAKVIDLTRRNGDDPVSIGLQRLRQQVELSAPANSTTVTTVMPVCTRTPSARVAEELAGSLRATGARVALFDLASAVPERKQSVLAGTALVPMDGGGVPSENHRQVVVHPQPDADALGLHAFGQLLAELARDHDHVICHVNPLTLSPAAISLASMTTCSVLISRRMETRKIEVARTISELSEEGTSNGRTVLVLVD